MRHWAFVMLKLVMALLAPIALIASCLFLLGVRRPLLYEIPDGYRGWVVIQYEDRTCPPLTRRGVYLVITIGQDGRTCTSDPFPQGWRPTDYQYVRSDGSRTKIPVTVRGRGGLIWGGHYVWPASQGRFFVGTEDELESGSYPRPEVPAPTTPP